jgi:tryptophanyl-tRNA synthetase
MLSPQLPEFEGECPVLVPVGIDQDPHLRLARDISRRIKKPKFTQLSSSYHMFLPGLKGGKMSASDPMSYISPSDSPSEVKMKINKYAFSGGRATIEEHRKKGGDPDVDVSFQYLRMFFEPDDKKLQEISENYKSGSLSTGELKKIAVEKITALLSGHQKKINKAEKQVGRFIYS